jgi:hypothetical protein
MLNKRSKWIAGLALAGIVGIYGTTRYLTKREPAWLERARPAHDQARCVDQPEPLADDAVTPLGKVEDLLHGLERTYTTGLYWTKAPGLVEQRAMGTRTQLDVTMHRSGRARYIHARAHYPSHGEPSGALICNERVEIDGHIEVRSRDGVLNERFDAPLALAVTRDMPAAGFQPVAPGPGHIDILAQLPLRTLKGSFAITKLKRDNLDAEEIELKLRFSPAGQIRGYIGGRYPVAEDPLSIWTTLVRFACFPQAACP